MKRYFAAVIPLVLLATHLGSTILYLAPTNPLTASYAPVVNRYMEPLFTQSWLLFAPDPATDNMKLWYRYRSDNQWSHWRDPLDNMLTDHQRNRFSSDGKILRIYSNIGMNLANEHTRLQYEFACKEDDVECGNSLEREIQKTDAYLLAARYVRELCLNESKVSAVKMDMMQFLIVDLHPKQFSERHEANPFGQVEYIEFQAVPFNAR